MNKIKLTLLALLCPLTYANADNWMHRLPDDAYVASLSIPGTHDTGTANGWADSAGKTFSQTQDINFEAQWNMGIRAFDFRPLVEGDQLRVAHGITKTELMFNTAMENLADWLDANPSEFAVIHLYYANDFDKDKEAYNTNLRALMASDKLKDKIVDFRRDLTVGDMRSKILLLSRQEYDTTPIGGFFKNWCGWIDWNAQTNGYITGANDGTFSTGALYVQDLAETHKDGELDKKKEAIKHMLDYTTTHYSTNPYQLVWTFNFASAYSKTLLGISTSEGYRDNATHTNKVILDYLKDDTKVAGPTGIILMDYVGVDETSGNEVVQAIIDQNFKYLGAPAKPLLGRQVSFIKDEQRDLTNKMGMGAKNFMPFVADFDGNGYMDVFFGGEAYAYNAEEDKWIWADGGFISLGHGAGNYPAWENYSDYKNETIPAFYGGKGRVAFDMDQDGDLDAIILDNRRSGWTAAHPNVGYCNFRVIKNVDNGKRFEDITAQCGGLGDVRLQNDNNSGAQMHNVAVADVNMDGYPDILIQGETLYGVEGVTWERATKLFINKGGEGFELAPDYFAGANSGSVLFGDFNCDGYPDILVSGYTQGDESLGVNDGECFVLYKNDGKGGFTVGSNLSEKYGKSGEETVMNVVDFDQDGKLDIFIVGSVPGVNGTKAGNGKIALLLRNTSDGTDFSFEEVETDIFPTSGNGSRASALADFNGDGFVDYMAQGWGQNKSWTDGMYASYSTAKGEYETVFGVLHGEEGWMGFGDVDGDGMIDFMSPYNNDNGAPMFYRNSTLIGTNAQCEVPGAPTNVTASYDEESKTLTLTWDEMQTSTGSKAIYNVYIEKDGKTFMRCPAVKESGKQTAYTSFGNYLQSATCKFEGIEPGTYKVGVQSVTYSWQASEFTAIDVNTVKEEEPQVGVVTFQQDNDRNFTNPMEMGAKNFMPFVADFDGNGLMDVFFGGEALNDGWADGAFISLNKGVAGTPEWENYKDYTGETLPAFYGGKGRIAFDMDQDGALDAIILDNRGSGWSSAHPNAGYCSFRVIKNVDNGKRFEDITAQCGGLGDVRLQNDNNNGSQMHNVAVADVNMDGYPDILIQGETLYGVEGVTWERATKLFINKGGEGFELAPAYFAGANNGSVLFGDFNCDGYPDVLVSGYTNGDESLGVKGGECFVLYKNDGKGGFTVGSNLSEKYGKSGDETVMNVVDFDQDGKLDIFIVGSVPGVNGTKADNGKIALLLRNTSDGTDFSFEEVETDIFPTSANGSRASALADFNGDGFVDYMAQGWGQNGEWTDGMYASYSTAKGEYETVFGVLHGEEGWMALGDVNGDGKLDFMSPWNNDNNAPMFYENTTECEIAVPDAPTNIEASYDEEAKTLTLTWDEMMTSTGSKAIYNVYIEKDGKTFMLCPAVKESGKQTAYTSFGNYLQSATCKFEGIEQGTYKVGVQSVTYSWQASEFTAIDVNTVKEEEPKVAVVTFLQDNDRNFTNPMEMGAKNFMPFVADFDGNGLMDVFFGGEAYNDGWADGAFISLNKGAAGTPEWENYKDYTGETLPVFYGGKGRIAFDMDQDGTLDAIILDNRGSGWTSAHPNVGYCSFRVIKNVDNGKRFEDITAQCGGLGDVRLQNDNNSGAQMHNVAVADVNMDGYPDILIQGETLYGVEGVTWERATKLFINKGGEGFELAPDYFAGANSGSVLFGDFNCDGYPDVLVSGYTNGDESLGVNGGECFVLYKNDGKGGFTVGSNLSEKYGKSGDETVMNVVDFDQDGKLDIFIVGSVPGVNGTKADNDKIALLLRNTSDGTDFSFEEVETDIFPTSGNGSRASALADFNGDGFVDYMAQGWGENNNWTDGMYASYSTAKGEYETVFGVLHGEEGWMALGDVNGDGKLDFMSPWNNDNNAPMFYENTTECEIAVPGAPTNVAYEYDEKAKTLTLTWDEMMTSTGSKAIYNVYIEKDGKTFMRCPAVKESGKQTAYTSFGNYLQSATCKFEGIEPGTYKVGVQSVTYSWQASEFTAIDATATGNVDNITSVAAEGENRIDVYTLSGVRIKSGACADDAVKGLKKGVYVVGGKKVVK